jgi:hypothetical protein
MHEKRVLRMRNGVRLHNGALRVEVTRHERPAQLLQRRFDAREFDQFPAIRIL